MDLPLTPAQADAFFNDGFVIIPNVFSAAEIEEMRAGFDRLAAIAQELGETQLHRGSQFVLERVTEGPRKGQVTIRRISWCAGADEVLSTYGQDQRLVRFAAQLLGSDEMNQLICQAHYKLPGDEVVFPWHQDSQHRGYGSEHWRDVNGRGSYVQTATALDDVTPDNGPLRFIPGTGATPHLGLTEGSPEEVRSHGLDPNTAVPAVMSVGSVALFGPYTLHGSAPNRSTNPRRVFINGFAYPGANTRVYPGDGAGRKVTLAQTV